MDLRTNIHELEVDPYELVRPGDQDKIVLTVMDNGIGVKDLDKSKLFKLFGCL